MTTIRPDGLIRWSDTRERSDTAAVIVCNSGALPFAGFLADGLVKLHPDADFDVVIALTDGPAPDAGRFPGVRLIGLDIGTWFDTLPTGPTIPRVSYARILLPAALPEYRRILYLDADILPRRSGVTNLLKVEPAAAVSIAPDAGAWFDNELAARPDILCNAGVLLIDAERARRERTMDRVLEFALTHPDRLTQHDQSALNLGLKGELGLLSPRWNWLDVKGADQFESEFDPVLVHFISHPKPWTWYEGHRRTRYFDVYAGFLQERYGITLKRSANSASWSEANSGNRKYRFWLREKISLIRRRRRLSNRNPDPHGYFDQAVPPGRLRTLHEMADL